MCIRDSTYPAQLMYLSLADMVCERITEMCIRDRFNDEAHHCYRQKPDGDNESTLKGDERKEAQKNNEAARVWISGLEIVNRKLGIRSVIDLSARCV